jgi:hypothetical protein
MDKIVSLFGKINLSQMIIGLILLISIVTLTYLLYFLSALSPDSSAAKSLLLWQGLLFVFFLLRILGRNAPYAGLLVKSQDKKVKLHGYDLIVLLSQVVVTLSASDLK